MLIESTTSRPNSQATINKLLEKDLKQIIVNLDSNDLINLFKNLQIDTQTNSSKYYTKIGLKCSECHTVFQNFQSKGYGRDQHEALINSIRIIFQSMIGSSYRIQNIKKALKYCSKYKQPLINSSQNSILQSSTKKSTKKVQGVQNVKMTKKHLDFYNIQQSANKQNISRKMNETLDLNGTQTQDKICIDTHEIRLNGQKFSKAHQGRPNYPLSQVDQQPKRQTSESKCLRNQNDKDCIYFQMHKHSQKQIKSLNARIKLLEQQNSMLKELLLKDFNREFFNKNKLEQEIRS